MVLRMDFRRQTIVLLVLAALLTAGCTRKFFRERADADVCALLTEKNRFAPWQIEQFHVYPDPRARFADGTDPDHPPMPPDDAAARHLSPNPQRPGKAGVARVEGTGYLDILAAWDAMNRASIEVLPQPDPAPVSTDGGADAEEKAFLITLEQACELGLFNSREFQDQRESLYLTALPVSLQRFSFAAQLFADGSVHRETTGADTALGRRERWRSSVNEGLTKTIPTGALLLFRFANQVAVEMLGGNPDVSVSNLTLELTQPLLRGGGRAVTLEPLTQAERNMLYQIRSYARFRKSFFVSLAGGRGGGGGLEDFTGGLSLPAGSLSSNSGYLPTVQRSGRLDIEKRNYRALQDLLQRFEAFAEGGEVSRLQVDQVKRDLLRARGTVNNADLQYRNTLDNFKRQLGLPPSLRIEVDTSALRPLTDQLDRYQRVLNEYNEIQVQANRDLTPAETAALRPRFRRLLLESRLVEGTPFREQIAERASAWEKRTDVQIRAELRRLADLLQQLLTEKAKLESAQQQIPNALRAQIVQIESETNLGRLEERLRDFEKQPWQAVGDPGAREQRRLSTMRNATAALELVLIEARNQRFDRLREAWPTPPSVCLDGVDLIGVPLEEAYAKSAQYALANRLDLMNERAQMVDSWRQIAVRANSLLGTLDIQYHLDSATPAGGLAPFAFAGSRSTHRVTANWELPLVRRLERNNYRVALINYQRQRRTLQVTEDNIILGLRSGVRELRVLAENYRIQQEQVALAYAQVENALETFSSPALPGGGGSNAGSQASLTQQLLQAQSGLNSAQSGLYDIWINYLTLRMQLFRDLELLPLDARGVWIDEHANECTVPFRHHDVPAERPAVERPSVERIPQPVQPVSGEIQWRATTVSKETRP
jgi:outer membrane protein TolC